MSRASGPDTNFEPPDPFVAAGPDHIVQSVNTSLRITNRQGGAAATLDLRTLFQLPAGVENADPRVIYDSLHGRWVVTELSFDCAPDEFAQFGHGYLDIAISRTSKPSTSLTDWYTGYLIYDDALLDYPGLGTSQDKLGLGTNAFAMVAGGDCTAGSFLGGVVTVFDWADVVANGGTNGLIDAEDVADPTWSTPRPTLQVPATAATLHVLSEVYNSTSGTLDPDYFTITGTVANDDLSIPVEHDLAAKNVVGSFADPPVPQQPGPDGVTSVDGIDGRPTDAVWQSNRLVFVSTTPCVPAGQSAATAHDCVRVADLSTVGINATTAPTRRQDLVIGTADMDNYLGGIGLAGNGTLHVVWTQSGTAAGQFPSSVAAYHRTSDSANAISATETLAAGQALYTGSRWGDYVGVAQDPQIPNAVWQANEYAASNGSWATTVSRLQTAGLRYVPITPTRVLDSRSGLGIGGTAAKFQANTAKTFQVTNGGTIPNTARAVTGNVTVVNQTAAGWVGVTPTANNNPGSSTINFPVGDTRANNVIATLGGGRLSATYKAPSGSSTNLLFDVTGYYVDDSSQDRYFTLTPARFLDSRTNNGTTGKFQNLVPKPVQITGRNGVPATARAVTANLTVVNQTAAGWVAALSSNPANPASPGSSTLNFPLRDTRANGVTVQLDGSGRVWLDYKGATGATTDLILDISGYYAPATTGGLDYYPLNPGRLMDSRGANLSVLTGKFSNLIPRQVPTAGHWGVAADAKAVAGNLTVVNQTAGGFVADTPTSPGSSVPAISTLNFPVGDIRANGLVATLGSGSQWLDYKGTTGAKTDLIFDLSGYFR